MSEQEIQYKKTLDKAINILKTNPNQIMEIVQAATRLSYLRGRLFEQSQQPEVIACHGEGVCTADGHSLNVGCEEIGTSSKNPFVDKNPQDDSRSSSGLPKEDTGDGTFPADSKYNEKWDSHYNEEKDIWLEPQCQYCNDRPTKPSECCLDSK